MEIELDAPVALIVRRIAIRLLDDATQAVPRIADPQDDEGLHDFRVALRRLRSLVRAYGKFVPGIVSDKLKKQLRTIQQATGAGRDAEVQLAWIRSRAKSMAAREMPGYKWIVSYLVQQQEHGYGAVTAAVSDYWTLEEKLQAHWSKLRIAKRRARDTHGRTYADVTAELVSRHMVELRAHLSHASSYESITECHDARIAAKRLRYLLEPLTSTAQQAGTAVSDLKKLQTVLGDLHDRHVLDQSLATALEVVYSERARYLCALVRGRANAKAVERGSNGGRRDETPGILALLRCAFEQGRALYDELRSGWIESHAGGLSEHCEELLVALNLPLAEPARGTPEQADTQ